MAVTITNRGTLKTAITSKLVRGDLTAQYDDFIQHGEILLNDDLRLLQQEVVIPTTVSLAQGAQTATLPTNFLEPISLQWSDVQSGPTQRTTDQIADLMSTTAGRPEYVAYSSAFFFERPADQAYTLKSRHFEKWALGAQDTDTNWLLTNDPLAYLYASLEAAAIQIRSADMIALWGAERSKRITKLNRRDARSRKGASLTVDAALSAIGGGHRGYDITRG